MKKAIFVTAICLLVLLAVSLAASAAPAWRVTIAAKIGTASATSYIGALSTGKDGKDSGDVAFQAPMGTWAAFVEYRYDSAWGSPLNTSFKQDMRALYTNGTKIWSNLFLNTNAPAGNTITLTLTPGTSSYTMPAGDYKLYFADGRTPVNLATSNTLTFTTAGDSAVAQMWAVCTVGTGPAVAKILDVTTSNSLTTAINSAPCMDDAENAYFGDEAGNIYKINLAAQEGVVANSGATTLGAAADGNIRGRMVYYNGYVYGVTSTGAVVKRNPSGASSADWTASIGANAGTTPTVDADGYVYVGVGNTLVKLDPNTGVQVAASSDLGGTVGCPSIPGTEQIWVNAGSNLICLGFDLQVRSMADNALAGTASYPEAIWRYNPGPKAPIVVAAGGNQVKIFDGSNLSLLKTVALSAAAAGQIYVDANAKVAIGTADRKVNVIGNALTDAAATQAALPALSAVTTAGAPVINNQGVIATTDNDNYVYLIYPSGTVTFVGINQPVYGCATDQSGNFYFAGVDGNIYSIVP